MNVSVQMHISGEIRVASIQTGVVYHTASSAADQNMHM